MYFKDITNQLHYLSEQDIENGGRALLPLGCNGITDEEAAAIRSIQNARTPEQIEADFTAAIQKRLDDFARTRNYDGILSACTYATSTLEKFKAEGQVCVNLRDATWAAAYEILAHVQAGQRPMPDSIEDIEGDLPVLGWAS